MVAQNRAPLAADVLLSEEDADRAYRRLQRLRGFRHGAAQLVSAVQAFLHSRISGKVTEKTLTEIALGLMLPQLAWLLVAEASLDAA
jgi:hypothetical protein